jgi:gliding motility-associated-like protein
MSLLTYFVNLRKIFYLLLLIATNTVSSQVFVNANVRINGFRHNHDCGNDAGGFNSQPDPRYRIWMGYNAGNFSQITSSPGLYSGCTDTYGADAVFCSSWNPGIINAITFNALPLNQINIDLETWEEDGCGSNCTSGTCTFNNDDVRCGRTRVGDINFWNQSPCQDMTYIGEYTSGSFLSMHNRCSDNNGKGYGIDRLIVNWDFASPPTILSDAFPFDRVLCPGESTTLTVSVNSWNGWSLGRLIQWQVSTNTDCNAPATWTDIPGATSLSYTPPQTPGTRLYRCIISSHCSDISQQQVISQCVRVTYHPYAAPIISNVCNSVAVPGVPVQFCTTQPPAPNASYANSSYQWSVSPAGGVTISNPTSACTDITFTTSGSVTISLTYGDACPEVNATAVCETTVSPPACDMIYVDGATGNNTNIGLPGAPVANLWRAFQLIGGGRNNIRITGGTYTEPNILNLQNDVFVDGRWQNNGGIWTKSSNQNTILNCSGEETIGTSVTHKVAFKASGINNWRLQDLIINTTDNSGTAPDGRGKSNYGVLIDNCSNYAVNRCQITVGRASNGGNGANGANGANGTQGAVGLLGHCDNNTTNRLGGAGATTNGTGVRQGGAGGNGGRGSDFDSNNNTDGINGSTGGGSALAGSGFGARGANGGGGTDTNRDGRKGGDGANGVLGTSGPLVAESTNSVFNNFWIPNGSAANGTDGGGGGGGQGGGGGGRQSCTFCDDGGGSGGGGGGSGGEGGQGGEGGRGGGGAFAIYRFNSNTGALIQDVVLNIPGIVTNGGAAGMGGIGGQGGAGGCGAGGNNTSTSSGGALGTNGGLCSTSRVCNNAEVGAGGQGGRGGNGGNGGNGQPGANGINAHMITDGVISNPTTSIPNPTTITLDYPVNAKGCNNSEVHLNNTNPSAWTLTGSTLLDDLNQSNSSFSYLSTPLVVYYPNAGTYDIGTNGIVYQDWINIIDGTRPAQANFNLPSSTVCSGSTINLNASPWGTELAWEWVMFQLTTISPISTQTTQTATYTFPNVSTPTTYQIRYRVREACCGWSKPYYTTITVVPVAEAVIASTSNIICPGETVTLSTSGGGTYLWSNNATTSSITVNTPGTYSVTVTDANGCTSTTSPLILDISPALSPLITAGSTSIICSPNGVTLTASGGSTYLWSNGETTPSITTTTAGVYDVLVTDDNGCNASSAPFTVYEVSANLFADGSSNICQGEILGLNVSSSYMDPTVTYVWMFNGSIISGENNSSLEVSQSGSYGVTVSNGTCTQNSATIDVTVFNPTITSTNNENTICTGSSLLLSTSIGNTFQWQLNGINIPGATNSTYSATTGGTYSVVVSNDNCTTNSNNIIITETVPTISNAGENQTICQVTSVSLSANNPVTGTGLWSITSGPNTSTSQFGNTSINNTTFTPMESGTYVLTWTISNSPCAASSSNVTITFIENSPCFCLSYPMKYANQTVDNDITNVTVGDLNNSSFCGENPGLNSVPFRYSNYTNSVPSATLVQGSNINFSLTSDICGGTDNQNFFLIYIDFNQNGSFAEVNEKVYSQIASGPTPFISSGQTVTGNFTVPSTALEGTTRMRIINTTGNFNSTNYAETNYSLGETEDYCVTIVSCISPTISSVNNSNTFCSGSTFLLTSSNGTSYQWQLNGVNIVGETNQTLSVTQSGSYTVVVTDGLCSATSSAFVVTAIIPTVTSSNGTNSLCPGETVTLTSSVGSSYQWQLNGNNIAGATNQTLTVTVGGIYNVLVITSDGSCTSLSADFLINEIIPTLTSLDNVTTFCPGESIILTSSSADSYQWQYNGVDIVGATLQTYNASQSGTYTVTTSFSGCISSSNNFLVTALIPTITSTNNNNLYCPGSTFELIASSGSSYQWELNGVNILGETNQSFVVTQSGSYSVVVVNGLCTSTSNIFEVIEIVPSISSNNGTNNLCPGESLILLSSTGSSYQWQLNGNNIPNETNQTLNITSGGSYTVVVTSTDGTCVSSSEAFVVTETVPTISSANNISTICPGETLTLFGSTAETYQWQLDNVNIVNGTSQNLVINQAGTYTVISSFFDGTCTSISEAFVVTEIIPVITGDGGGSSICPGSSLQLTASNADLYQWQLNGVNIAGATSQSYSATQAGIYTVTTLISGCVSTSSNFVVTEISPTISSTNNQSTFCPGTILTLTSSIGTDYQWQLNGSNLVGETNQTITIAQSGSYTVVVTDGFCSATSSVFVVNEIIPTVTSSNGTNSLCPGETITLTSSVGSSYQWQLNGNSIIGETNQTLTITAGGTYNIIVTSSDESCTSTSAAFVITETIPIVTSTNNVTIICPGESIILTSSLADSYQWQLNGFDIAGQTNQTLTITEVGDYTVITSNSSCISTSLIFSIDNFSATISSNNGQNVICSGQSLLLTSSIGTSYQWQNNGTNIFGATNQTYTVNQAGSYTVTVNDGTCTSTSQAFIVTQFSPEVTTNNNIVTICPGTSLTLNATAGQSYQWSLNGQAINGATNQSYTATQAGVYTVAINNGVCTSTTLPFTISVFNPVVTSANGVTSVCPGASVTLTATQGASYQWFLNGTPIAGATNQTFDATQAGTYSVSVNNGNCAVTSGNFVLSTFSPTVSSTSGSDLLCPGGNIVLNATAGTSYQWQLNGVNLAGETNSNLIANEPGNYTVIVNNGVCSSTSAVFTVSFYTPVITGAGGSNQICQGGTLVLTASNGVSYQWQLNGVDIPGATNASYTATQAGTYNVVVNNGSCTVSSSNFILTEIVNPTPSINVTAAGGCAPTSGTISSSGTFTAITWFVNNTQVSTDPSFNFTFSQAGCYTVTAVGTLNNGCSVNVTDAQAICLTPSPNAFFTVYPSFFSQEIQNITFNNASTDAVSYAWNFGDESFSYEFNTQHTFTNTSGGYTVSLTATSETGCTDIHVVTIPFIENGSVYYVPNTFTPDGDSFNQTFMPVFSSGFDPYDFEMTIFNRWGEMVFVSRDVTYGWDGSFGENGLNAPDGVYVWKIIYKSPQNDRREILVGHVNLIR